jgi:hypothetical protein
MTMNYPAKIILAWGESISGNHVLRNWLMQNGYPELGLFVFALKNHDESRDWLLRNGHPHLMALINGAEGNVNALAWLRMQEFDVLEKMARAADHDEKAMNWLIENDYKDMAVIAAKMMYVKDQIEEDNNDVHKISSS